MSSIFEHIGARVRMLRKNRGFTQAVLAEKIDVPQSYIANIERGTKNISLEMIEKISNALNLPPDQLFKNIERSSASFEKDRKIDAVVASLESRSIDEIQVIARLINDVIRAFDAKQ